MKKYVSGKTLAILAVILVVLLFLIATKTSNSNNSSAQKNAIQSILTPVQSGLTKISNRFSGFFSHFTDITVLQEENEKLSQEIDELTVEIRNLEDYKLENERLKILLELKENSEYETVSALVVAKDSSYWFSKFTINKGTNDGIEKYCSVITSKGLVGNVTEVGSNWATVTSLIDPDSSVGAVLERTQDTAIVEGNVDLAYEGLCRVTYISRDAQLLTGDIIVTSGLGGLYPKGLSIGKVREVEPDTKGMSQYAIVEPAVDFSKINEVLVLKRQVIKDE